MAENFRAAEIRRRIRRIEDRIAELTERYQPALSGLNYALEKSKEAKYLRIELQDLYLIQKDKKLKLTAAQSRRILELENKIPVYEEEIALIEETTRFAEEKITPNTHFDDLT